MANGENLKVNKGVNLNTAIALIQLCVIIAGIIVGLKYAEFRANSTDTRLDKFEYRQDQLIEKVDGIKTDVEVLKARPRR